MLMRNLKFLSALLLILGSGVALVGCGDDSTSGSTPGFTCGEGTKEENGVCTPTGTTDPGKTCGAGTVAQGNECVAQTTNPTVTCGAGTREQNGVCVPTNPGGNDITCGPGTVNNGSNVCVPENSFTCGNGTIAQGDVCVRVCPDGTIANANGGCDIDIEIPPPDLDAICSPGTYQYRGRCLSLEELVREQAVQIVASSDTAASQDDPFMYNYDLDGFNLFGQMIYEFLGSSRFNGGSATSFTLPTQGDTVLLTGTISLLGDITGDGVPDQDWDVFSFQGAAGQVLNVGVASEGLEVPYLEVLRFEGVNTAANIVSELGDIAAFNEAQQYLRLTPIAQGFATQRKVLLPTDGLYFIRVTDGGFAPPTLRTCDAIDEFFWNCPVGGAIPYFTDLGSPTGGPNYKYRASVQTLPPVDFTALPTLNINGSLAQVWSGSANSYSNVDTEIVLARDPDNNPTFLEVEVNAYDSKAYGTGVLTVGDLTNSARATLGIGAAGVRLGLPVPPSGWVIGHDHIVAQGLATEGYRVTLRAAAELSDGVAFVTSMEDAPNDDLGFSRDHFLTVPKGNVVEVVASNIGNGITPILSMWSVGGIDDNFAINLLGCAGPEGVVNAAVCSVIPAGQPLSVVRYFPGNPSETENISIIMLDADSGEGNIYGFTLTPSIIPPSMLTLNDANNVTSATVNAGSLNASAGNAARWSVLSYTPGTQTKSLEVESAPNAGSNAVLTTTLYTQVDPTATTSGRVSVTASATASGPGASTLIAVTAPSTATNFLIKNAVGATSGQSATSVTVDADLVSIPTLSGSNDLCANAQVVAMSGSYIVDLFDATPNYTATIVGGLGADETGIATACNDPNGDGEGLAFGWPSSTAAPDSFFRVTIPANSRLTVEAGGTGQGADPILLIVRDSGTVCTDLTTKNGQAVCLVADDDSLGGASGFFARAIYNNTTATAINAVVVVKNWRVPNANADSNNVSFTIAPN